MVLQKNTLQTQQSHVFSNKDYLSGPDMPHNGQRPLCHRITSIHPNRATTSRSRI